MATSAVRTLIVPRTMPATQNTAPVFEYRCLHTSDIRRKQKRWQDGRLKFHTFNKRVMVYDEQGNFVGDTHWHEDYEFEEGLEVELERSGTLVQVSECVGKRNQDLTELWDKRQKEGKENGFKEMATSSSLLPPESIVQTQAYILPHSSASQHSSTKRRRLNDSPPIKSGYAQNLTGATLTLSRGIPSIAALSSDCLSKERLRNPIESVGLSRMGSTTASKMIIMPKMSYEQEGRKKTASKAARSLQKSRGIGPARSPTGATLLPNDKVGNRSTVEDESTSNKTCYSALGEAAMQDDGFREVRAYATNIAQSPPKSESFQDGTIGKDQTTLLAVKPKPLSLNTLAQSENGSWIRCEKPAKPLRIKAQPKRRLLLVARTQTDKPTAKKHVKLTNDTVADLTMLQEESKDFSQAENEASAFPGFQYQRRSARPNVDTVSPNTEHFSSEIERLRHHPTGVLLSCKPFEALGRTGCKPCKVQVATELSDAPSIVKNSSDRLSGPELDPLNLNNSVANCLPSLQTREDQLNVHQEIQAMLIGEDNSNGKNQIKACVKAETSEKVLKAGPNEESPRSNYLILNTNLATIISKPAHQPIERPILKTEAVLQEPQSKPSNTSARRRAAPLHRNIAGRGPEPLVQYARLTSEPSALVSMIRPLRESIGRTKEEQGPWSREAFDLFDWRPQIKSTGDVLAGS